MKRNKLLSMLLVLIMCVSLCACGGGSDNVSRNDDISKEDLLANAEEVDLFDIVIETPSNILKAQEQWCDKDLLISGCIWEIKKDHVVLYNAGGTNDVTFEVYLPTDEIMNLEQAQLIKVVGHTEAEIEEGSISPINPTYTYVMKNAYFVTDTFEQVCVLKGENESYAPAFNIQVGESNVWQLVYFDESVDTSKLEWDEEVKISSKISYANVWTRTEAVIVE